MPEDFLEGMRRSSQARMERAQQELPLASLRRLVDGLPPPPALHRSSQGFDLIAELKLRSPAMGKLKDAQSTDVAARVLDYAGAGAAAVSVLTEPSRFDGSMQHLKEAARALADASVPAMRKDFLVDPYQVLEARAAGAGGVLVILRMLERPALDALIDSALEQRMFVLLEAFDEADIALAHQLVARRTHDHRLLLVGLNCRDLVTLQVVPDRLEKLASSLPTTVSRVAESGVASAEDAARVAAAGYDLALVGSALMSGPDPQSLASTMLSAARAVVGERGA